MKEYIPKHFYDTYFYTILDETLEELEQDFQKNYEIYKQDFILNFKDICNKIKITYPNFNLSYLNYNLMLVNILNKNYNYNVYIYDEDWYLKGDIKILNYNVEYIYKYFEKMWDKLLKKSKGYIFKINDTDIRNLMIETTEKFHRYVVSIMRNSIVELTDTEEYKILNKDKIFNIQTGKFYDIYDLIYTENNVKNPIKIKRWLEKNKKEEYCNEDFKNLNLNNFNFFYYDLRGSDFRECELQETYFFYSLLIGTKFKNCDLRNSNITLSLLNEVNFENADLTNSRITSSMIYRGKFNSFIDVGFLNANFKNTNLTNVNFTDSFLQCVDFSKAIIENTNFENCIFRNCIFNEEQLKKINLTDEQMNNIIII